MNVVLQVAVMAKDVPNKAFIKKILAEPAKLAAKQAKEVLIRIVSVDEIQKLNHTYRHKDAPTNVLSFPMQTVPGLEPSSLGDIIICHDVLKKEAAAQHKSLEHHYAHMLIHGFLHLLGYDHIKPEDAEVMEALEIKFLQELTIKNPYEENP